MKKLILISALALILCGCDGGGQRKERVLKSNGDTSTILIDTVFIHGQKHEILTRREAYGKGGVGGLMHSPECWCLKKGK